MLFLCFVVVKCCCGEVLRFDIFGDYFVVLFDVDKDNDGWFELVWVENFLKFVFFFVFVGDEFDVLFNSIDGFVCVVDSDDGWVM